MNSPLNQWLVLSRPECSLCDSFLQALCELLGESAAAVTVQDITDHAELESKYGNRLPVLLVNGEFVCAYRLDASRVAAYLV